MNKERVKSLQEKMGLDKKRAKSVAIAQDKMAVPDIRGVVERMGEKMDLSLAEIERLISTGTREEKLQKARDVILYLGLRDRKFAALVEYLKSEGAYIIKTEETHKYELSDEDKAEIIRLIGEIKRDFSKGDSGASILPTKPHLLSG